MFSNFILSSGSGSTTVPTAVPSKTLFCEHSKIQWNNITGFTFVDNTGKVLTMGRSQSVQAGHENDWLSRYGSSTSVASLLDGTLNAIDFFMTENGFCAILDDPAGYRAVAWGSNLGTGQHERSASTPVSAVAGTQNSFVFINGTTGFAYPLGDYRHGGEPIVFFMDIYDADRLSYINTNLSTDNTFLTANTNCFTLANASIDNWNSTHDPDLPYLVDDDNYLHLVPISPEWDSSELRAQRSIAQQRVNNFSNAYETLAENNRATNTDISSFNVNSYLQNSADKIVNVFSTWGAFAALHESGKVSTWGRAEYGGDIYSASYDYAGATWDLSHTVVLRNGSKVVVDIASTGYGFAARCSDGSVIAWGGWVSGATNLLATIPSELLSSLNGTIPVIKVYGSRTAAFAAIRSDGSCITWGDPNSGGDGSSSVPSPHNKNGQVSLRLKGDKLSNKVAEVFATNNAFAFLLKDGSVVCCGNQSRGGKFTAYDFYDTIPSGAPITNNAVSMLLNGSIPCVTIISNFYAFAALRSDGTVVTWGDQQYRTMTSATYAAINNPSNPVIRLFSNNAAFCAVLADNSVVSWGNQSQGGDITLVASLLNGTYEIIDILNDHYQFAAILNKSGNNVVNWGESGATTGVWGYISTAIDIVGGATLNR